MSTDQIKRFERWRKTLPTSTSYLVSLVIEVIVAEFEQHGFDRFPEYAGGAKNVAANNIPLQRRSGTEWPTVELLFDRRKRPFLGLTFAMLPEICVRITELGETEIPRIEANVVEGPAFFHLCKGHRGNYDCNFGYVWFALDFKSKLNREVGMMKELLPSLFGIFEQGIPRQWLQGAFGYVDDHVFLSPASRVFRKRNADLQ